MSDPSQTTSDPIGLALVVLALIGIPFAIWLAHKWNDTTRRRESILASLAHPPSHAARTYQTCHIHGQRIPTGGDCAVCVEHLHRDLEALEWGE